MDTLILITLTVLGMEYVCWNFTLGRSVRVRIANRPKFDLEENNAQNKQHILGNFCVNIVHMIIKLWK